MVTSVSTKACSARMRSMWLASGAEELLLAHSTTPGISEQALATEHRFGTTKGFPPKYALAIGIVG